MPFLAPWLHTAGAKAQQTWRSFERVTRRWLPFPSACRYLGHRIDRRRTWYDQLNIRASCQRCGFPMIRDTGRWREFDMARDSNARRCAHPGSGH